MRTEQSRREKEKKRKEQGWGLKRSREKKWDEKEVR